MKQFSYAQQEHINTGNFRQAGALDLQLVFVLLAAGFLILCAVKIAPSYIDHWTIRTAMEAVEQEIDPAKATKRDIKKRLTARLIVNRIEDVNEKTIEITRTRDLLTVSAPYEKRIPLMFNIDVVLKFPDTGFEAAIRGG